MYNENKTGILFSILIYEHMRMQNMKKFFSLNLSVVPNFVAI